MKKLEFHPSLKEVPMMPLHERDALATNIEKQGQIVPIVLLNGKVIDGRNRYLACLSRSIEPKTVDIVLSDDPRDYVESMNYFRKHWTTGERAHFAAMMSLDSTEGRHKTTTSNDVVTESKAAEVMNVSVPSVQRAKAKIRCKNEKKTKPVQRGNGETVEMDSGGKVIPSTALPYWRRKNEVQEIINQINSIKRKMNDAQSDPMYCEVGVNGVLSSLNDVVGRLRAAIPAHVCPYCKGEKPVGCKACKSRGVVSKYFWDTAVPKEMKPEQPF